MWAVDDAEAVVIIQQCKRFQSRQPCIHKSFQGSYVGFGIHTVAFLAIGLIQSTVAVIRYIPDDRIDAPLELSTIAIVGRQISQSEVEYMWSETDAIQTVGVIAK